MYEVNDQSLMETPVARRLPVRKISGGLENAENVGELGNVVKGEGNEEELGDLEKKGKKKFKHAPFMVKLGIMLSRSSGRDKFAALLQYGAMFWGNQFVFPVSSARDAPWRNLEDSMSTGRKTLRLFKWIKEFERMQRAFYFADNGPHLTESRRAVASVLGFFMHSLSFAYYFVDNMLYMSQVGLINRPSVVGVPELRTMLKTGLPHEEYLKLQKRYRSDEVQRQSSRLFEDQLKDAKNYSSLFRLLIAIVYSCLQIQSANETLTLLDAKNPDDIKKIASLEELKSENYREILASICNLVILLNRLQVSVFKKVPLWGVGVLGVIAAGFGLEKNWPTETSS